MKYLTAPYLTLMNAFKDRALERLDDPSWAYLHPISLMQEYGTIRIDAGRQTGKSEAAAMFADEWLAEGNDVIVISTTLSHANELRDRIKRKKGNITRVDAKKPGFLVTDTMRSFLDGNGFSKYRGLSLTRALIIIEEPIKVPEMYKFYEAYLTLANKYLCQGQRPLPLFLVMGIQ